MREIQSIRGPLRAFPLLVGLALVGCSDSKSPPAKTSSPGGRTKRDPQTLPPAPPQISDEQATANRPVVKMTVPDFVTQYQKDMKSLYSGLKSSAVELNGTIKDISPWKAKRGGGSVDLAASGKESKSVKCYFAEPMIWDKVSVHQTVKIKGVTPSEDSFPSGPMLLQCVVVDLQKNPTPSLTSEELAGEYAKDQKGTIDKYNKRKKIIVRGVVVEKTMPTKLAPALILKGKDSVRVEAGFTGSSEDKTAVDRIKVGDTVTVLGEVLDFEHKPTTFALRFCDILKGP